MDNLDLILELLLEQELEAPESMDKILSAYSSITTFSSKKKIIDGLTIYDDIDTSAAFIFKFPTERVRYFHTVGMKFPIDIYFFNSNKELILKYKNIKPGVEHISSKRPAMYVIEVKSDETV